MAKSKEQYIAERTDDFDTDVYTFDLVDAHTVERLARDGDIKLPYKELDPEKDIRWNTKQFASRLLQGILNGDPIPNIANNLLDVVGYNEASAMRNARTMTTAAENIGRQDSYEELADKGVVQKKVWIATPDDRTRASHLELDGEEVDIDEEFSNGCMYPADPDCRDGSEIYNCRCSMRDRIVGFRRADGSISYVGRERDTTMHADQIAQERQAREKIEKLEARIPNGFLNKDDVIGSLDKLSPKSQAAWIDFINRAKYKYIDNDQDGAYYDPSDETVYLFDYSSGDTFFHETAHAIDDDCIDGSIEILGKRKVIGSDEWRDTNGFTQPIKSASQAAQTIYELNKTAWEDDQASFMKWAGMKDEEDLTALIKAVRDFEKKYGSDAASTLGDLIDAQTLGKYPMSIFAGGHGADYWRSDYAHATREAWAEISALKAQGQDDAVNALMEILPNRVRSQVQIYEIVFNGGKPYEHESVTKTDYAISKEIWRFRRKH